MQRHVVPVSGQLVVVGAPLDTQIHTGEIRLPPGECVEEVGIDEQLLLRHQGVLDLTPQCGHVPRVLRPAHVDGGGQRAQQARVADVAHEHRSSRSQRSHRPAQDWWR